jgi:hypothetical protein
MLTLLNLLSIILSLNSLNIEETNPNLYGSWLNGDGEILTIQTDNTFKRTNSSKVLAIGKIKIVDNQIHVTRTDVSDQYMLKYYLGNETFVVTKPRSDQAWLFSRIGN